MSDNNLNILVLLRECNDPRPPARAITRGADISDRGLRRIPNPADMSSLEEALRLKQSQGAKVTAVAIGPERLDDLLRLAVSMGADRCIRFWDHGLHGSDAVADARVLSRIVHILSPKLLFTGSRLPDRGDDPVPALAAALEGIPCLASVTKLRVNKSSVEALRKVDRGGSQEVVAPYPCFVQFEETAVPRYPTVDAVADAVKAPVEKWNLVTLGLPSWEVGASGAYLTLAEYGIPRPDPVRVVTPDAQLPTFERILSLLSGGIKAREGKMRTGSADELSTGIWQILREEGVAP